MAQIDENRLIVLLYCEMAILDMRKLSFDKFDFDFRNNYVFNFWNPFDEKKPTEINSFFVISDDYIILQLSEMDCTSGVNLCVSKYQRVVDLKEKTIDKSKNYTLFGSFYNNMKRLNENTIITADNEAIRLWTY